jgi:hypothetical protein
MEALGGRGGIAPTHSQHHSSGVRRISVMTQSLRHQLGDAFYDFALLIFRFYLFLTVITHYYSFTLYEHFRCLYSSYFKLHALTVYINSVRTIYAVPDDESIDSKHKNTTSINI